MSQPLTREELAKQMENVIDCALSVLATDNLDVPEEIWNEVLAEVLETKAHYAS
jgi:hypothetical protein